MPNREALLDLAVSCPTQHTPCRQHTRPHLPLIHMPQVRNLVPNREALLDLAVSGPLYGCAASGALLLAGFGLSAAGFTTVGESL